MPRHRPRLPLPSRPDRSGFSRIEPDQTHSDRAPSGLIWTNLDKSGRRRRIAGAPERAPHRSTAPFQHRPKPTTSNHPERAETQCFPRPGPIFSLPPPEEKISANHPTATRAAERSRTHPNRSRSNSQPTTGYRAIRTENRRSSQDNRTSWPTGTSNSSSRANAPSSSTAPAVLPEEARTCARCRRQERFSGARSAARSRCWEGTDRTHPLEVRVRRGASPPASSTRDHSSAWRKSGVLRTMISLPACVMGYGVSRK